jgi:hypothetical protein
MEMFLKDIELFGVYNNMQISLFDENKKYLQYHNNFVFRDNIKKHYSN